MADFSHFSRLSYVLNLNIMTYSDLVLFMSVGLIISIPILPSCLENSLEIPESHSSNSLVLSFLAIRLTITVTGLEFFLELISSSSFIANYRNRILVIYYTWHLNPSNIRCNGWDPRLKDKGSNPTPDLLTSI